MPQFLDTPVEYLKGVGPQRGEILKKELSIFTLDQLLKHYPLRYVDKRNFYKIKDLNTQLQYIQVKGRIMDFSVAGDGKSKRLVATFEDETGKMELLWFQGIKFIESFLIKGSEYVAFGKPGFFNNKFSIVHPEIESVVELEAPGSTRIQPIYPLSDGMRRRRFESKALRGIIQSALNSPQLHIEENLPQSLVTKHNFPNKRAAIKNVHFPDSFDNLDHALKRLKYEEFFFQQLKMIRLRKVRVQSAKGHVFGEIGSYFMDFYKNHLPFELTNAQKKVIKEIRKDLGSGVQMNRLLQGDVGSGKTMVALLTMLVALDNGFQTCLMAPTEILASQHFESISSALQNMDIKVLLLTGSTTKKEKALILEQCATKKNLILIGTHALIEDDVKFADLGLVVIDEQHRFGVAQRARLWEKGNLAPHILVMTATPIPRTLAMTVFGDLETSIIDEMPEGRKPVSTFIRNDGARPIVMDFVRKEIEKGRQVYFVFPLIEESEKLNLKNLMDGFDMVADYFPAPQFQMSILHGRMKPAEKESEMKRFKNGISHIMVATTVIEVGVNVPNASLMIIESAERFGLPQLHQLRGRVGRGADQSYCILMHGQKVGNDAKQRLQAMASTNNGFEIANLDLKLRGPGDIEGTRQSGLLDFKLADIIKDEAILASARKDAIETLEKDPYLSLPENQTLLRFLKTQNKGINWSKIS